MRKLISMMVLLVLVLLGCGCGSEGDLVIFNGSIWTMDPDMPYANYILIKDGRFVEVGEGKVSPANFHKVKRFIDLGGCSVVPGLIDAHGHVLGLGKSLMQLRLQDATSPEDVRMMVLEEAEGRKSGEWIEGRGWDQNDWAGKAFPTWRDLEGTDTSPVYLRRIDGHAAWVNKRALEIAGIDKNTPDPEGGKILRDKSGNPTGVLVDNAVSLVADMIPAPSFEQKLEWARRAIAECNRVGLVGVHDAGMDSTTIEVYRELKRRGELTLRIYGMLDGEDDRLLAQWMKDGIEVDKDGLLTIRSIKLYSDGALGSRGAALLEDYSDDPGNKGLLVTSKERIDSVATLALKHGFQVCTHAIGDRGNRMVLDAYESALNRKHSENHRFRVEHAQVVNPEDLPRFAELGVLPSMQPTHCTSDMDWAESRLGSERVKGAYAWDSFIQSGTLVPFGSDFPIESPNPVYGIYAAMTRKDRIGLPIGGWYPEQRVSFDDALAGFTTSAAYAAFEEESRGRIKKGYHADLTIFGGRFVQQNPGLIAAMSVSMTMIDGKSVYSLSDQKISGQK